MGFCWGPWQTSINNVKNSIKNLFRTFMSGKLLSKLNLTLGFQIISLNLLVEQKINVLELTLYHLTLSLLQVNMTVMVLRLKKVGCFRMHYVFVLYWVTRDMLVSGLLFAICNSIFATCKSKFLFLRIEIFKIMNYLLSLAVQH